MFSSLVKGQTDWHSPLNANFATAADKLTLKADCVYDAEANAYTMTIRNIPAEIAAALPSGLPDYFTIVSRFPNDYAEGATFRVGTMEFTAKYAGFEAGDVLSLNFDKAEQRCFFRVGGGSISATPTAYCGSAYAGYSYLG